MNKPTLRVAAAFLLLTIGNAHADVLIVRPDGAQGFGDVQSAVDASAHGDTILVQTGTYAGFEIIDRSITVVADFNAEVLIANTVTIRDLALDRIVILSGLELRGVDRDRFLTKEGTVQSQITTDSLHLLNNLGPVRINRCSLQGGNADVLVSSSGYSTPDPAGSEAALVDSCMDVLFSGCTLSGGNGGYHPQNFGISGDSGVGLSLENSGVTVWDCTLTGGSSAAGYTSGGDGGHACENRGGHLTVATSILRGGRGGDGTDGISGFEGSGGSAVFTSTGGNSYLSGVDATAGANGNGFSYPLPPAPLFAGQGILAQDTSIERILSAPRIAVEGAPLELVYQGKTGDSLRLLYGYSTSTLFREIFPLPILVAKPGRLTDASIATISTLSGSATAFFDLLDLPPAAGAREIWMQGFVSSADGRTHLTSPVAVTVIQCSSLQLDCNGNSQFDSCDVALGFSEDCLNDGVPDECEPDCNGNGSPDACDIDAGTSLDCQGNGVPDECEPDCNTDGIPDDCEEDCNLNGVADPCDIASAQSLDLDFNEIPDECDGPIGNPIYVDDDAAPRGDGTAAAPFADIRSAVLVAAPGNSIVVADGLYQDPFNGEISIDDDIDLISENGPAHCIVDCEDSHRFLTVRPTTAERARGRLRGFTIRNATTGSSFAEGGAIQFRSCVDYRVENCLFEDCGKLPSGAFVRSGGAIYAEYCERITVGNCRFMRNEAFFGGAISAYFSDEIDVQGCLFVNNRGDNGGAVNSWESRTRIFDSTFKTNEARRGGAVVLDAGLPTVKRCVFAENSADFSGGGIDAFLDSASSPTPPISHCAFLGNHAGDGGGLFIRTEGDETLRFDHCLLAGNTAMSGAGAYLTGNALVTHCTLVDNIATSIGGGLRAVYGSNLELRNSILWGNSSPAGPQLYTFNAFSFAARFCDIQGFPLIPIAGCGEPWCSTNFDVDPFFVDADGPDNNPATLFGNDWRLSANSPLLDAGSNAIAPPDLLDLDRDGDRFEPVSYDLNLRPRFHDVPNPDTGVGPGPIVDIGAFERQP